MEIIRDRTFLFAVPDLAPQEQPKSYCFIQRAEKKFKFVVQC